MADLGKSYADFKNKCECEQKDCHGSRSCPEVRETLVMTVHGPFYMCDDCASRLPIEYHKDSCSCGWCV